MNIRSGSGQPGLSDNGFNTENSTSRRKSKSKRESSVTNSTPEPAKKRERRSANRSYIENESNDNVCLDSLDPKERTLKIRTSLLQLIAAASQVEIKVFTSAVVEAEAIEENENILNQSVQNNFQKLRSYPEAICELVTMYTKLRRFPKFIAKLLCCFRDYIFNESNLEFEDPNHIEGSSEIDLITIFLPHEFVTALEPVFSALPAGQMIELFKTFYHNLYEECVKPICQSNGKDCIRRNYFLHIVTSLLSAVLTNVKLADYATAALTMEKVSEILSKISDECLLSLGELVQSKKGTHLLRPFLALAVAWGDLHGFLLHYKNDVYKQDIKKWFKLACSDPHEANITLIHSYLPSDAWQQISIKIERTGDKKCEELWAKLMIQKLKYMTILGKPTYVSKAIDEDSFQDQLRTTTSYLLSHQDSYKLSLNELYKLTSQHMDETQILAFVKHVVRHGSDLENEALVNNSQFNAKFEATLCVETMDLILNRMNKLKILPKWCRKKLTSDVFSNDKKIDMISSVSGRNSTMLHSYLEIVNELIEKIDQPENQEENPDFACDEVIVAKLAFLNSLFLEDYPAHLKTMIALSSIVFLLIANVQSGQTDFIVETISSILFQTASQPKGNETLFAVAWSSMYKWLCSNAHRIRSPSLKKVLLVILHNVYVSSKSITEFEVVAAKEESFSIDSPMTPIHLITLEFLLKELPVSTQAKSKLTPQLQDHIRRLTHVVVKALRKSSSSKSQRYATDSSLLSNIFHACWLTQLALPNLSSETRTETESMNDYENSTTKLKKICCKHIESAFEILHDKKTSTTNQEDTSDDKCDFDDNAKFAKTFARIFLHTVCKSRKELGERLPQTFVNQLWTVCLNTRDEDWNDCEKIAPTEDTRLMAKDMFEMAKPEEFSELKDSILNEIKNVADTENEEVKLKSLVHILNCLLDAVLQKPEQKDDRREILDGVLCLMVNTCLRWKSSNECLINMVLPVIEFQTKLLKRKNAMCSAICSATCLSSITSIPLNDIIDMKLYRDVFCSAAELLNAFTIHRLDVLTFRMPIYLQCFQFLIESVTSRASQDNKLSDAEIIDLKYCAHEIERTCQSMKLNQKEFSRVSPYFVAILMKQFEMFAVYPAVKNPLLSGCYKLLDLCDSHAVAQLNSMLTVGARETFKSVYELYNKFYRYKGKV